MPQGRAKKIQFLLPLAGFSLRCLEHCLTAAGLVGGRALMVNAGDDEAAAFWQRRGFAPSRDDPLILFRPIAVIAASLGQSRSRAPAT
ncbi:MAG TPA: hypothetical protein VND19_04000 [Acetobacteraceae bacterium]|nr:hypothetical protein [Acetobacteraceae bacterium]